MQDAVAVIVEDHEDTAEILKVILNSEGINALWFQDFESAASSLSTITPCVVMMDLMGMSSKMTPKDFVDYVKSIFPRVPVVVVSAAAKVQALAVEIKADLFVSKPFDIELVQGLAKRICHRQYNPSCGG